MGNAPPGRTQATVAPDATNQGKSETVAADHEQQPGVIDQAAKVGTCEGNAQPPNTDLSHTPAITTLKDEPPIKKPSMKLNIAPLPKANNLLAPANGLISPTGALSPVKGLAPIRAAGGGDGNGRNRAGSDDLSIRGGRIRGSVNQLPSTPMHQAAYTGKLEELQTLVAAGNVDISSVDDAGHTLLFYSITRNHVEVCEWLLARDQSLCNVQVDSTSVGSQLPLFLASSQGNSPSIIEVLIKSGADVHARDVKGRNASHVAEKRECLQMLVQHGVQLRALDLTGQNAMTTACSEGRSDCVEYLCETCEAEVLRELISHQDSFGNNSLQNAAKHGHFKCIELLHPHCWEDLFRQKNRAGQLASEIAKVNGHEACYDLIRHFEPSEPAIHEFPSQSIAKSETESKLHEEGKDWSEYFDQGTGSSYWYNQETSETTWTRPGTVDVNGRDHQNTDQHHEMNDRHFSAIGQISAHTQHVHHEHQDGGQHGYHPLLNSEQVGNSSSKADVLVIHHDEPSDFQETDGLHLVYNAEDPNDVVHDDPLWSSTTQHHHQFQHARPMTAAPTYSSHSTSWYPGTVDENHQSTSDQWNNHHHNTWESHARPSTAMVPTLYGNENHRDSFYQNSNPIHGEESYHHGPTYTNQTYYMRPNTAQSYNSVFSGLETNFDFNNTHAMELDEDQGYTQHTEMHDDGRPNSPWTQRRNQGVVEDWYGEWAQYVDPETNRMFWWNSITGENTWDPPQQVAQQQHQNVTNHQQHDVDYLGIGSPGVSHIGSIEQQSMHHVNPGSGFANSEAHHIRQRSFVVGKIGEWTECKDPVSGDVFFYNNNTGECEWELPPEVEDARIQALAHEQAEIEKQALQEAEGWVWTMRRKQDISTIPNQGGVWSMMQDAETGAVFYMNRDTGETRWNEPDEFRQHDDATPLKPVPSVNFSEEEKLAIMERAKREAREEFLAQAKKEALDANEMKKMTEQITHDAAKQMAEQMKKAMDESKVAQDQLAEQLRKQTEMQLQMLKEQTDAMNERMKAQAEQEEELKSKLEEEIRKKKDIAQALEAKLQAAEYEAQAHAKRQEELNKRQIQRTETKQNVSAIREEKAEILAEHEQELKELAAVLAADRTRQAAKLKEKLEERRRKRALQRAAALNKAKPKESFSGASTRSLSIPEGDQKSKELKIVTRTTPIPTLKLSNDANELFDDLTNEPCNKLVQKLLIKSQSLNAVVEFNRQFLDVRNESGEKEFQEKLAKSPGIWFVWALYRYFCTESASSVKGSPPMSPSSSDTRLLGRLLMTPTAFRGFMRAVGFAQAPPRKMKGLGTGELDKLYLGFRGNTTPGLTFLNFLRVLSEVATQVLLSETVECLDGNEGSDEKAGKRLFVPVFEKHLFEPGRAIARFMFKRSERYQKESKALANNQVRNVLQANVTQLKAVYMHFIKVLYRRNGGKKTQAITMRETFQFASLFSVVPDMCTCRDMFRIFEDMHVIKTLPISSLASYEIPFNKWVQLLFHAAVRFHKVDVDFTPMSPTSSGADGKEGGDTKPTQLSKVPEAHVAVIAFLSWLERSGAADKASIRGLESFHLSCEAPPKPAQPPPKDDKA